MPALSMARWRLVARLCQESGDAIKHLSGVRRRHQAPVRMEGEERYPNRSGQHLHRTVNSEPPHAENSEPAITLSTHQDGGRQQRRCGGRVTPVN